MLRSKRVPVTPVGVQFRVDVNVTIPRCTRNFNWPSGEGTQQALYKMHFLLETNLYVWRQYSDGVTQNVLLPKINRDKQFISFNNIWFEAGIYWLFEPTRAKHFDRPDRNVNCFAFIVAKTDTKSLLLSLFKIDHIWLYNCN